MTLIDKDEALAALEGVWRTMIGGAEVQRKVNAAIAAIPARGVGVKPLVWKEDGPEWPNCFHAITPVGRYEIGPYNKGVFSCHVEPEMRDIGLSFRSPDAAKAAAQADYEARILAALAPTDAAQAREAALMEAVARLRAAPVSGDTAIALGNAHAIAVLEALIGEPRT